MLLHIQEVFETSIKQDQKRISLHIIIKTQNKHTEQSKHTESRKGKAITMTPDYSTNALKEGKE